MPRFPVDPPQLVRVPPAAALARWETGELVGEAKHALVVRVRPGYVKREYAATKRLDTGEDLLMQTIVASEHQYPPWVGTWTPVGPWRTLPHIQNSKWARSFDQNGSSTLTVLMDNIAFVSNEGVAGIFRDIKRGYFSPSRGVVLASRPSLWDDTGWTNALNGGYQIEVWEGYGSGAEIIPLDVPDPVTNSCAPPGGAISRTWTGIIETVDLTSHPDHITLTSRDFGVLFTDQRIQGTNKAAEIVAPTTFADQSHSMGIRPVGPRPTMESPLYLQWLEDFSKNKLGEYLQATGNLHYDGSHSVHELIVATGGGAGILKPNVWMQGGLITIKGASDARFVVDMPGCFRYDTRAALAEVRDNQGHVIAGATGSYPVLYYDADSGQLSLGFGDVDPQTGDMEWREFTNVGPGPGHAVQPTITLYPGVAGDPGVDGAFTGLTIISNTPVTLPGDVLNSAQAPHAVTPSSVASSSSYVGGSGKDYGDSELWLSAIQDTPAAHQHVDVSFGRAWPTPAMWTTAGPGAMNQAVIQGTSESQDAKAVGPAPLRDLGTLSAPLSPAVAYLDAEILTGATVKRLLVDGVTQPIVAGTVIKVVGQDAFFEKAEDEGFPVIEQDFTVTANVAIGATKIPVTPVAAADLWSPGDVVLLGEPLSALPMAPPSEVASGRVLLVTDPTGGWKQTFTAYAPHDTSGGQGILREVPAYAFPAGSTVQVVGLAPANTGIGQFRLFTMTPLFSGCEMWVSLRIDDPDGATMDGKPIPHGWVDLNRGVTPDGVPALFRAVLDFETAGPLTFDLGHVFDTGKVWKLLSDGSTDGQLLTTDAVPGVTLRVTFSSLKTGAPVMPPSTRYMSTADYNALKAALTPGHYITGLQDIGLFGFYPWDPGLADPVATLTEALRDSPHVTTKLKVSPLKRAVPSGASVNVSAPAGQQVVGDQMAPIDRWSFTARATAPVGAIEIEVVPTVLPAAKYEWKVPKGKAIPEWIQTQAGVTVLSGGPVQLRETFLTAPPASLQFGCGTLREIDSYPDGADVAGLINAVHWVMVNDASEVVEVLCKWAGFKEWNLQWFGWSLINPMQYGSDKFFIDIINDILSQGNFVFYMDGPTDNDASIGVPCFVQQAAVAAPPAELIELTDQNLLETAEVKWDLSSLPSVLRYRGNPVPDGTQGATYEEDLVATFMATYFPPWAGDDYVPLNGDPPPAPPLRRTAGLVRHFTQTVGVNVPIGMNSNEQCLFACLLAAMQYAVGMGTGSIQIPGLDGFSLNQQIGVTEEADGINSRMWLASIESDHSTGPNGKWLMVLGGSYLDTEDLDLLLDDYLYALTQVKPQQPSGEQYEGVPKAAVGGWQVSTGQELYTPPFGALGTG